MSNQNLSKEAEQGFFKNNLKRNIRDDILHLLKISRYALNVTKIAGKLNLSRNTVKNYLGQFEREGLIRVQEIGRAKLCILLKGKEDQLASLIPPFYNNFFEVFDRIAPVYLESPPDFLRELGKEMAELTVWPTGPLITPEAGEITIDQLSNLAFEFIAFLNIFGNLFHAELDQSMASAITLKITSLSAEYRFNESLFQIWAGLLEAKLHKFRGENIYLKMLRFEKETASCYYELGINEVK